eukprot:g1516.t1
MSKLTEYNLFGSQDSELEETSYLGTVAQRRGNLSKTITKVNKENLPSLTASPRKKNGGKPRKHRPNTKKRRLSTDSEQTNESQPLSLVQDMEILPNKAEYCDSDNEEENFSSFNEEDSLEVDSINTNNHSATFNKRHKQDIQTKQGKRNVQTEANQLNLKQPNANTSTQQQLQEPRNEPDWTQMSLKERIRAKKKRSREKQRDGSRTNHDEPKQQQNRKEKLKKPGTEAASDLQNTVVEVLQEVQGKQTTREKDDHLPLTRLTGTALEAAKFRRTLLYYLSAHANRIQNDTAYDIEWTLNTDIPRQGFAPETMLILSEIVFNYARVVHNELKAFAKHRSRSNGGRNITVDDVLLLARKDANLQRLLREAIPTRPTKRKR